MRRGVNTRWIKDRRPVHLRTLDELSAEIDRLVTAEAAGRVRALGNWSAAQIIQHIGKLIEFSFDGFPFRYGRGVSLITRLVRLAAGWQALVRLAMRPGFRNPSQAALLEPDPAVTFDAAAAYLRRQVDRIRRGEQMTRSEAFEGLYSHEQWLYVHLRHAELHLSFLKLLDD